MKPLQFALIIVVFSGWLIGDGVTQNQFNHVRPVAGQDDINTDIEVEVNPGINVNAPLECEVGELVRFDARGSQVDSLVWDIIPETDDFETVDNKFRGFFSARAGGEYLLLIAGAKNGKAFLWHQTLKVRGTPPALAGMTAKVRDWLTLLPPIPEDEQKRKLEAMAGVFKKLSEQPINTEDILNATALANSAVLGDSVMTWAPFLDKLGSELDVLIDKGKLETQEQYKTTWGEIAAALERNAG